MKNLFARKIIAICLILTAGLFAFHFLKAEYSGVRGKRVYVDLAAAQEMIGQLLPGS